MNIQVQNITLRIRKQPHQKDVTSVRDMVSETGFFRDDEIDVAVELVEERLAKGTKSGYQFILADHEGNLAGYTCFGLIPCSLVSFDLYWIVTRKILQGKGIGAILLQLTEEEIQKQGGKNVIIETSSKELYGPTQHFYHKNGYMLQARLPDFYDIGDDKLVFTKRLSEAMQ